MTTKSVGYWLGQIPQFLAQLLGFVLLIWPCYRAAWTINAVSNKTWGPPHEDLNGRVIDTWNWKWLNRWYGNPEDGVSGRFALVWNGPELVRYNPTGSRWKAYVWSAWRNSSDALKYDFPQS
jgi:hypothetical protein